MAVLTDHPTAVPLDPALSPYTGWTRDHWVALAKRLLAAGRRHGSDNHARIHFPGAVGGYGRNVDGLEGFARSLMAAGFLAAGSGDVSDLDWYAPGFATGPDPTLDPSRRWVRPGEHDQAKVEACSLALVLHLTRPYLWDTFDSRTRELLVDYFAEWIHSAYPSNNWVWFRLIVQQFMRSVGGPWSADDLDEDLAFVESCHVADGWYRDGAGRTFDYYGGWVFQVYPLLWCDMLPEDPATQTLRPVFQHRLDAYLADAVVLTGADGGMLAQGRSLIYRYAQAATFWMGAYSGSSALSPGLVRRVTSGLVRHFTDRGVPGADGVLTLGWYDQWRPLAQSYSGPGSPYWACKGLLGLALPPDHPVWTATEEPLPIEGGDFVRALPVPGWAVSGSGGVVRIANHGTDHALPGDTRADSPLYARYGYSSATFPLLDAAAWVNPIDQSVSLLDDTGRASHRTGFTPLGAYEAEGVAVAASRCFAHWVDPAPVQERHGSGYVGSATPAGDITVVSVVRGAWELRAVGLVSRGRGAASATAVTLRIGGWAVAGDQVASSVWEHSGMRVARATTAHQYSDLRTLDEATPGVEFHQDASPLGASAGVPYLDFPLTGDWRTVLVTLQPSPAPAGEDERFMALIRPGKTDIRVHVVWPDGVVSDVLVPLAPSVGKAPAAPVATMVTNKEP